MHERKQEREQNTYVDLSPSLKYAFTASFRSPPCSCG
jgi:hypothetical protein